MAAAQDAFGVSVGTERIGLYNDRSVRGFSPVTAGNVRLESVYIDIQGSLNNRLVQGSTVRVGLTALGYAFPAPTGIVDYRLRGTHATNGIGLSGQVGSFGSMALEADGKLALAGDRLSLAGGLSLHRSENYPGIANRSVNIALALPWKLGEGFEATPFWSYTRNSEEEQPTVFVAGPYLPPDIDGEHFDQPWTDQEREQETYGTLLRAQFSPWIGLRAGVFRSRQTTFESYSDVFRNTTPDGFADHSVSASPKEQRASTSGEMVLTLRAAEGPRSHAIHLLGRGRFADSLYGGSDSVHLGRARIGTIDPRPKPAYAFGEQSTNAVRQITGGIGYEGRWEGVGEINAGLQRTGYRKTVARPGQAETSIANQPWLYSVSAALSVNSRIALYGGYTKGLEENGTAPDVSSNRGEPLPAAITSQREAGVRFVLRPDLRLVAGAFDLRKPYYSLDQRNVFTHLGSLKTRGIELSLAGTFAAGLNVVAGAVLMDPQVTGEAVELGRVGMRPVGQTQQQWRMNIDYRLPFWSALSLDAGIVHTGPVAASVRPDPATGEQMNVPARTEIDLGLRYRFRIADNPAVLRVRLQNLTDTRGWDPTSSGGFRVQNPRRFQAQLSADF